MQCFFYIPSAPKPVENAGNGDIHIVVPNTKPKPVNKPSPANRYVKGTFLHKMTNSIHL